MEWVSVDERKPNCEQSVLAHYVNELGKYRIVRAVWLEPFTVEADWKSDNE